MMAARWMLHGAVGDKLVLFFAHFDQTNVKDPPVSQTIVLTGQVSTCPTRLVPARLWTHRQSLMSTARRRRTLALF